MIIKLIKNPNSNSIEANWIEEKTINTSVLVEKDIDGELIRVKENKDITVETIIHCQSFSDTQIDLLRQTAKNYKTPLSQEQEEIIADVIANIVLPTKEELEAIASENEKLQKQENRKALMLKGKDYNGHQISFTKDDGDGLVQVKSAFELGLTETTIHFDCGTNFPIKVEDFGAFALWFVTERNKFFIEEV